MDTPSEWCNSDLFGRCISRVVRIIPTCFSPSSATRRQVGDVDVNFVNVDAGPAASSSVPVPASAGSVMQVPPPLFFLSANQGSMIHRCLPLSFLAIAT